MVSPPTLTQLLLTSLSAIKPSLSTTASRRFSHRNHVRQVHLHYGNDSTANGHPYEAHSSIRLLDIVDSNDDAIATVADVLEDSSTISSIFDTSHRYPVKMPSVSPMIEPPTTDAPTFVGYDPLLYEPLRINIDTRRLQSSEPTFQSYLTAAAEQASSFWSQHLSTVPVSSLIEITQESCPLAFDNQEYQPHSFNESDVVIYLFADEGPCLGESPPIAFSDECVMDQFDRPIAGWILLCSANFQSISLNTAEGVSQRQKLNEVLQHEFAHILGMSGSTMAYWRDPLRGGAPRTSRPLEVKEIECVNGTVINMTVPSEDTVRVGVTGSGVRYFEVVTPTVVNVVANQFDCKAGATTVDTVGARLDNFEHFDCIGSHWSSRYFADETMVSRNMPWEQSISAVTLALFEDTGWYKANFSAAEPASFGYGAGCGFLTSDCILDDGVPEFGEDTFCKTLTEESAIRCDASHKRFTKCDLIDYSTYAQNPLYPYLNTPAAPESEYQYFTNTNLGSFLRYDGDYCPTYTAPPYSTYNNGTADGVLYAECASGRDMLADVYDFEYFESDASRCFNTAGNIDRPLCLNTECSLSGSDVSILVTVTDGEKVICESDGQVINLESLGIEIECPRREVICPEYFCPANCSGRGLCRHQKSNGCQCFDVSDESPICENSPTQQPYEMPTPIPSPAPVQTASLTETPSYSPTEEETNFPSVLAAIIGPTLSNSAYEEVPAEDDKVESEMKSLACNIRVGSELWYLTAYLTLAMTIHCLIA